MYNKIKDLCIFNTTSIIPDNSEKYLFENIIYGAELFGFKKFPDKLKIRIHICNKKTFKDKKKALMYTNNPAYDSKHIIAFTCNVNKIFVLEYKDISRNCSLGNYSAIILHECIHVLQAYFSMLPSLQYAWLYESVACYLAKQEKKYDYKNDVLWETFTSNFYEINNCYGLAYQFGMALFMQFDHRTLNVLKDPNAYTDQLMDLYRSLFNKQ